VYRERHKSLAEAYKQEIFNHVATVQTEILDKSVQTHIWTKKGNLVQLLKGVCEESHADFLLLNELDAERPEELADLVVGVPCSLILVK
jgi:hypothetical protein